VIDAPTEGGEHDNTPILCIQDDNGITPEGTLQGATNQVAPAAANGVTSWLAAGRTDRA
jgi:hypothetical protein